MIEAEAQANIDTALDSVRAHEATLPMLRAELEDASHAIAAAERDFDADPSDVHWNAVVRARDRRDRLALRTTHAEERLQRLTAEHEEAKRELLRLRLKDARDRTSLASVRAAMRADLEHLVWLEAEASSSVARIHRHIEAHAEACKEAEALEVQLGIRPLENGIPRALPRVKPFQAMTLARTLIREAQRRTARRDNGAAEWLSPHPRARAEWASPHGAHDLPDTLFTRAGEMFVEVDAILDAAAQGASASKAAE